MKKILVPTDFSEIAKNATDYAVNICRLLGADLVIFHSIGTNELKSEAKLSHEKERIIRKHTGISFEFLATDKYFNSLTIENEIGSKNLELIIIGTGGEQTFLKKLFGTNATEISEEMKCPVLVVPDGCKFHGIETIVYASDLYNLKQELPQVIRFAKFFKSEVQVLHISPVFPDLGDLDKRNIPAEIRTILENDPYPLISYHEERTPYDNQAHKGITNFIETYHPGLVVFFHRRREGFDKFISSTETERSVSHFKIPMLVFHKE